MIGPPKRNDWVNLAQCAVDDPALCWLPVKGFTDAERWMQLALAEARKGLGRTSPNPAVGAVIVSKGRVLARGHHREAGGPHAEIEALARLRKPAPRDAVLYVTLEPCSTTGRTPPCADAIAASGLRRVVIGAIDPNPRHGGRGLAFLENAGIKVTSCVLPNECAALNPGYNKWIQTGRPFVIAKCAMSLDGRLSRAPGESQWLTSAAARRNVHALRAQVDAILIGAETLRKDNPRLTVRPGKKARQPWRVVVTRSGEMPKTSRLFTDGLSERTLVFQGKSLAETFSELGRREVTSVLIEGGGMVLGEALDARLIDRFEIFYAPLLTGGATKAFSGRGAGSTLEALRLRDVRYEQIGPDVKMTALPHPDFFRE